MAFNLVVREPFTLIMPDPASTKDAPLPDVSTSFEKGAVIDDKAMMKAVADKSLDAHVVRVAAPPAPEPDPAPAPKSKAE